MPMPERTGKHLGDVMPRAGMMYAFEHQILKRNEHDKKIRKALENAGFTTRGEVDKALAETCSKAMHWDQFPEFQRPAFLEVFQPLVPWAAELDGNLFGDFFFALVRARQRWNVYPRRPLDKTQHSRTAKELDMLIQVFGDQYARFDHEFASLLDDEQKKKDDAALKKKEDEEDARAAEMAALMEGLDAVGDEAPAKPVGDEAQDGDTADDDNAMELDG
ncbi:hypothetical protein F5Y18DRAFT_431943 [Xylariaceae sp. FL1019]|nr:hypothetical protein F5Y18DRAFT_431943 [Xylariaceae sp. FL1019]